MKTIAGFSVLGGLTLLALVAALSIALRAKLRGRAELVIATSVLWNFLIALPIYTLGLAHRLGPALLAATSLATSAIALLASKRGVPFSEYRAQLVRASWGLVKMPIDAIRLTWARRSPALLGVIVSMGFVTSTAVASYLAPSWRSWDALWYHEPIIGFTIQNHGFGPVDLPMMMGKINGYPRLGEMTQLWFAIFTDRRLIDLPNTLLAPALMSSVYALCLRFSGDRAEAMGWGSCIVLMPGCANLFQSTFIDPQNAAFVLAATHFCTLPSARLRHFWLGSLCLGLATATKILSIVPVLVLGTMAAVRLVHRRRELGQSAAFTTLFVGAGFIVAVACTTYLRNWLHFHNPFYPDLKLDIARLHIHWPGMAEWADKDHRQGQGLELNEPLSVLFDQLYSRPGSVTTWHYGELMDYGLGVVWVVLPLGLLGLVVGTCKWCWSTIERRFVDRRAVAPEDRQLSNLMPIVLLTGILLWSSPALWAARYHIATAGLLMAGVAWFASRGWRRLSEGAMFVTIVTSLMMFWWAEPCWWLRPAQLKELLRVPYPSREVTPELGSPVTLEAGLARELELRAGTLLVYTESVFPAIFWNNHYSNRVVYLPADPDFLERADAAGANWICCGPVTCPSLVDAKGRWEEVGSYDAQHTLRAFRRVAH